MATLFDAPAEDLIEATAEKLADELEQPDWAEFAKTGTARELPPEQEDFWALRGASLLRKVAVDGPVGVDRLSTAYGGAKKGSTRYRVRPHGKTSGSKKVIRTLLQQLDDAGYISTNEKRGREVTGPGRQLLDETAAEVIEDLDRPELERYA
ncbi:30S ribosomal protein S19e [Halosegnis marinus]|uniref:Small ribosomal subunit protein eS19 n=1 Tax=Halosegnis marinus TaxID=3034023 RepID=A0ABD5ZQ65_9EURY|nr:30S ribosomal protein S19e [Halosegnis sp. DT85]